MVQAEGREKDSAAVQVLVRQDPGRVRSRQEDTVRAVTAGGEQATAQPIALLIVADGMGGHQGGDTASQAAAAAVAATLGPLLQRLQPIPTLRLPDPALGADEEDDSQAPDPMRTVNLSRPTVNLTEAAVHLDAAASEPQAPRLDAGQIEAALLEAVAGAQAAVRAAAQEIDALDDAGTTLTVGLIAGMTLFCAQVGDSRAYLWRHSQLRRLTLDHSGAAALVAAGVISEEEARDHPVAHQLYRYLGGPAHAAKADIAKHALAPGDMVLLCSDGLWDMLGDAAIAGQLLAAIDLEDAAARLIDAANTAGGEDNITVVLAQLAAEREE